MVVHCRRDKYGTDNKFHSFHISYQSTQSKYSNIKVRYKLLTQEGNRKKSRPRVSHQPKSETEPRAKRHCPPQLVRPVCRKPTPNLPPQKGGWENSQREQAAKNKSNCSKETRRKKTSYSSISARPQHKSKVCVGQRFTRPFPELCCKGQWNKSRKVNYSKLHK